MPDYIESVDVKVSVNIYYDGSVQSRTLRYPDGTVRTLGVYLPGEFVFHSECPETVRITSGCVDVLFPTDKKWREVKTGQIYEVPANTRFKVRCEVVTEYICDFL